MSVFSLRSALGRVCGPAIAGPVIYVGHDFRDLVMRGKKPDLSLSLSNSLSLSRAPLPAISLSLSLFSLSLLSLSLSSLSLLSLFSLSLLSLSLSCSRVHVTQVLRMIAWHMSSFSHKLHVSIDVEAPAGVLT